MIKKMTLLAMVAGALAAFAAPSMAGAAQLTNAPPTKGLVAVGTTLVGTSTNTVTVFDGTGITLTCEKVTVNGIVAKNNGKEVEIKMDEPSKDSATGCKATGLGAITIDPTLTSIVASGAGPGTASFDFTATGLCEEKSTTSEVTWFGTNKIHIKANTTGGCGEGTLSGDFFLETTSGAEIIAET